MKKTLLPLLFVLLGGCAANSIINDSHSEKKIPTNHQRGFSSNSNISEQCEEITKKAAAKIKNSEDICDSAQEKYKFAHSVISQGCITPNLAGLKRRSLNIWNSSCNGVQMRAIEGF
jgi:hypothetical protein